MGATPSSWRNRRIRSRRRIRCGGRIRREAAILLFAVAALPVGTSAQSDELSTACLPGSECTLAAAAVRALHPRIGLGLFGGSSVLGSASTLGMRIGATPRVSLSLRGTVVPLELTPLPDRATRGPSPRATREGTRRLAGGLAGQATVGLLGGWSPEATIGGVGSLDGLVRVSWLGLPDDAFDGDVLGLWVALRLGLLRESFTLPGISVTAGYGRSTSFTYGEPELDDGFIRGAIGNWKAAAAASRRFGAVGITAGTSYDRFTGDVDFAYRGAAAPETAGATTDRWSFYGDVSLTRLVFHLSLEAGWQSAPRPGRLPPDVSLDPTGWWGGAAFRLSI
jgi:hypothetical protein